MLKDGAEVCSVRRIPAAEIESAVIDQLRALLRAPEIVVGTWRAARQWLARIEESEVCEALQQLNQLWDELFPAEQARIVQLLVERIDVRAEFADVRLRVEGLSAVFAEMRSAERNPRRVA